jgi:hypothetical protein
LEGKNRTLGGRGSKMTKRNRTSFMDVPHKAFRLEISWGWAKTAAFLGLGITIFTFQ